MFEMLIFVGCYEGCLVGVGERYIILLVSDCASIGLLLRLEMVLTLAVEALGVIGSHLVEF